eukprot:Hpha_TRINITY_DN15583_c1_g1::TRINITY_DN15583_c1_g1_i1::g.103972::m.103972
MLAAAVTAVALAGLPAKSVGLYCLIADDTVANRTSSSVWQPKLYPYQQTGANVLYLTFLNPDSIPDLPPAMTALVKCRGQPGCPTSSQKVLISVGGQAYSNKKWSWLASDTAAEAMAEKVAASWPALGVDGIDLDVEGAAGSGSAASSALLAFAKKLRQLKPDFAVTQPVYGYPQIDAENNMVNHGWKNGTSLNVIDSVGIMVYGGTSSLQYLKNYVNATEQWQGFPITTDVPPGAVVPGMSGDAGDSEIASMAQAIKSKALGGMMVWYASVLDATTGAIAFQYGGGNGDSSNKQSSAWEQALKAIQ